MLIPTRTLSLEGKVYAPVLSPFLTPTLETVLTLTLDDITPTMHARMKLLTALLEQKSVYNLSPDDLVRSVKRVLGGGIFFNVSRDSLSLITDYSSNQRTDRSKRGSHCPWRS